VEQQRAVAIEGAKKSFGELAGALGRLKDLDSKGPGKGVSYLILHEEVQDIRREFITHVALDAEPPQTPANPTTSTK
jgi:hypothetical protein